MTQATSIRNSVRTIIEDLGKVARRYSYDNATKTETKEGGITISSWSTATTFKGISSNHFKYRRISAILGIDNDSSDRVFIIKDNVTVERRDRIIIGDDTYEVGEIKKLDPIEETVIAQRLVLIKNVNY